MNDFDKSNSNKIADAVITGRDIEDSVTKIVSRFEMFHN